MGGKKKNGSKKNRNKRGVWVDSPCDFELKKGPGPDPSTGTIEEIEGLVGKLGISDGDTNDIEGGSSSVGAAAVGQDGIGVVVVENGRSNTDNLNEEEGRDCDTVKAADIPVEINLNGVEGFEVACDGDGGGGGGGKVVGVESSGAAGGSMTSKKDLRLIHKKWKASSKCVERGKIVSTIAKNCPEVRILNEGFDLMNGIPERYGRYTNPTCLWDARKFANKFSSGASSFNLATGVDGSIVANSSFVSDWENIKDLVTSPFKDDSRSFLLHKVGKSVFVDRFDLQNLVGHRLYSEWPWLEQFVLDNCAESVDKKLEIMREGKSESEIMAKAHYLKLLYFGLGEMLETESSEDISMDDDHFLTELGKLVPDSKLRGSKKIFLNKVQTRFAGFSVLAGSDVPVCKEPSKNRDGMKTSIRLVHREAEAETGDFEIDTLTAMDIWLDNVLLGIPKTLVVEECKGKVVSNHIIDTDDIPAYGLFNPEPLMQEVEIILKHVFNGVTECGHTYLLHKPPGAIEFKFFNLTAESQAAEKKDKEKSCEDQNPYRLALGAYLCTAAVDGMRLWKVATFESMVRHGAYLLEKVQPMVKVASKILMSYARGSYRNPGLQPSIYYDWPEETDYLENDDALHSDLLNLYLVISAFEKMDTGSGKYYEELSKPTESAMILSKYYNSCAHKVDKNCSFVAHYIWSKRHLFPTKPNALSTFKVGRIATHEPFDVALELQENSNEAKRLKKLESQIRKEKTKNLNQRSCKSSFPSLSEAQLEEVKKIVHSKAFEHPDQKLPIPVWFEAVGCARMALELVSALKELLFIKDNYDPSVIRQFEVQIVNGLGEICVRLAEANAEIHVPAITRFLYTLLYEIPLLTEHGTGCSSFVADTLIMNAKETTFDAIRNWGWEHDETLDPKMVQMGKEIRNLADSRVSLNFSILMQNCILKVADLIDSFPEKLGPTEDAFPTVPRYNGDLNKFYHEMLKHMDAVADYMPLHKVHLIDKTKNEISKDVHAADSNIQIIADDESCDFFKDLKFSMWSVPDLRKVLAKKKRSGIKVCRETFVNSEEKLAESKEDSPLSVTYVGVDVKNEWDQEQIEIVKTYSLFYNLFS